MLVKTEHPGLVRDTVSTAIINTNNEAYENYKIARDERIRSRALAAELGALQGELGEIKQMLNQLIKRD